MMYRQAGLLTLVSLSLAMAQEAPGGERPRPGAALSGRL
jgi:hypothetical protein